MTDLVPIRDLVLRFYHRLWNQWDDTAVDNTLAPGLTFRGSLGHRTIGRDGWRTYRDQIRCGAPDFHNEVLDLVTEGPRAAARLRFSGTHLVRCSAPPRPDGRSVMSAPPSSAAPRTSSPTSGCSVTSTTSAAN
jgi:hypothetical protein